MQDEDALIDAAAGGDQDAFAVLFHRYRAYVYTIAWKIALHEDDALDITQIVFTRAAGRLGEYRGDGTFRAWLAAIAAREACSLRRRPHLAHETVTAPEDLHRLAEAGNDGLLPSQRDVVEQAWQRDRVHLAMTQLSPQQRAILTLNVGEDMGPSKVAERLGIPPKQVRSQMARAIGQLREILASQETNMSQSKGRNR